MNAPPDQLAATVVFPVNRSRNPITLSPAVLGVPSLADHEIVVWVTSCGVHGPVIVQIGRGFRASVTSARTLVGEPCITSNASCVAGAPVQLACMAAHAGTDTGLGAGEGDGEGLGEGLGDGLGVGLGVGLGDGVGEGLVWATAGPFAVQPATASRRHASTTPILTEDSTSGGGPTLRASSFRARRPE